jgi:hypothetical protein
MEKMLTDGFWHGGPALMLASARNAMARGDATMLVAAWQQLEQARRYVHPWKDRVLNSASRSWRQDLQEWASAPSDVLFCTPAVLAQGNRVIGATAHPLTVILLEPLAQIQGTLESLGRTCARLAVVDVESATEMTWSRIPLHEPPRVAEPRRPAETL